MSCPVARGGVHLGHRFPTDGALLRIVSFAGHLARPSARLLALHDYFTTHEVARMAHVSPSTVLNWIDRGLLGAHRTVGGHRRVPRDQLVRFLREHSMPVPARLTEVGRLLILDADPRTLGLTVDLLQACAPHLAVDGYPNAVVGLLACGADPPDAVLLDVGLTHVDALEICRKLTQASPPVRVVATSRAPSASQRAAYTRAGASGYLALPTCAGCLLGAIGLRDDVAAGMGHSEGQRHEGHSPVGHCSCAPGAARVDSST